MKIKGVIEDLKFFKNLKKKEGKTEPKNSKNLYRIFSDGVVGIVGSVHFQPDPCSGLYFSRSTGPFLCSRY